MPKKTQNGHDKSMEAVLMGKPKRGGRSKACNKHRDVIYLNIFTRTQISIEN